MIASLTLSSISADLDDQWSQEEVIINQIPHYNTDYKGAVASPANSSVTKPTGLLPTGWIELCIPQPNESCTHFSNPGISLLVSADSRYYTMRLQEDRVHEGAEESRQQERHRTPPPSYLDNSTQHCENIAQPCRVACYGMNNSTTVGCYPTLKRMIENKDENRLLFWALVEIMAVSISADFQRLRPAMQAFDPTRHSELSKDPYSILNNLNRTALDELCVLVRDVEEKLRYNRWALVSWQEKHMILNFLLEPARKHHIDKYYALEIIGRFRRVKSCSGWRSDTLIQYRTPSNHGSISTRKSMMLDLGDTWTSHASLISSMKGKGVDALVLVLEDAIKSRQGYDGRYRLQNSVEMREMASSGTKMCGWPLSNGYFKLARLLRESHTFDQYEQNRYQLKILRRFFLRDLRSPIR